MDIIRHYAGSHAYGTALPSSDIDIRGVFVSDRTDYLNPFYTKDQIEGSKDEDIVLMELDKYVRLAAQGNPNILESLWIDEEHIITKHPAYETLKLIRNECIHQRTITAHVEYAKSQLRRITGHNKYITNPQSETPPSQKDFVKIIGVYNSDITLSEIRTGSGMRLTRLHGDVFRIDRTRDLKNSLWDKKGHLKISTKKIDDPDLVPDAIISYNSVDFEKANSLWKSYWSWKKNRNIDRRELEEHHGYDTKHASHLIRLCLTAKGIMDDGIVYVKHPQAQLLRDIRAGKYSLQEVTEMADDMWDDLDKFKQTLPKNANLDFIGKVAQQVREQAWSEVQ